MQALLFPERRLFEQVIGNRHEYLHRSGTFALLCQGRTFGNTKGELLHKVGEESTRHRLGLRDVTHDRVQHRMHALYQERRGVVKRKSSMEKFEKIYSIFL